MQKLLFTGIVNAILINAALGFLMKTSVIKSETKFMWMVENLKELPNNVKSLPFKINLSWNGTEVVSFESELTLKTSTPYTGEELNVKLDSIRLKPYDKQIALNGSVNIRNSTNHIIGKKMIKKLSIGSSHTLYRADLFTVNSKELFEGAYEMPHDTWIFDFFITASTPVTTYVNLE